MKFFMKVLVLPFLVALFILGGKAVDAQAAETIPNITELGSCDVTRFSEHLAAEDYLIVTSEPASNNRTTYRYMFFTDSPAFVREGNDIVVYPTSGVLDQYYLTKQTDGSFTWTGAGTGGTKEYIVWESGSRVLLGSNFEFPSEYSGFPQCNIDWYYSFAPVIPTTSVPIVVDGVEYTVEEPYPYYFISYGYNEISLYFSEMPFTVTPFDKWFKLIPNADSPEVVSYKWDSSSDVGFLESRSVDNSGSRIIYYTSNDYACNYTLYFTGSLGQIALLPKSFYPELDELYAALPDELSSYTYFIILRQTHEDAYTNDVVFYGWNDVNADLIIRWGDSKIAAVKKGTIVSDSIKARYDLASESWVIDSSVVIGTCRNNTYNVPYIYYSNSDLFVQQSNQTGWYTSGLCAYMADLEAPNIWFEEEEPDEITGIEWLDGLLNGIGSLFSRLFVPSPVFLQKKVDILTSRFGFWASVRDTIVVFYEFFSETDFTKPPKVSLNLGEVNSKINYGLSAYSLDLTWYEPYKADVDAIVSAVLWVVFVWNTFKNLPNTIRGIGGGFVSTASAAHSKGGEK